MIPLPLANPEPVPLIPIPIYQLTTTPTFKDKKEPTYPDEARKKGIQGTVILEVLIDAKGKIRNVSVLQSPAECLARAAKAALEQSLISPGLMGSKPVPVKMKIPYRFVLDS